MRIKRVAAVAAVAALALGLTACGGDDGGEGTGADSKSFTANLPEAPKVPAFEIPGFEAPKFDLPELDLPTTEEVTAAYYNFVDQFVANSKSFTERFIAAATPAAVAA